MNRDISIQKYPYGRDSDIYIKVEVYGGPLHHKVHQIFGFSRSESKVLLKLLKEVVK